MTDDAIKDQVKEATDIVAVIGQYVTLRRRGSNLLGLCPFHTEKTPSFNVNADRQFFHCFGCGKGGDVFTFLMEHEGWSFPETLKYCAEKAGIKLPEYRDQSDPQSRLRDEMSAALELADKIYRHALFTPLGKQALDYLTNRGFQEQTLKRAGVGFAPPSYESVLKSAESRGISRKALEAAGLIIPSQKGGNPYDRFRNRITFPIVNLSGKTVGFGARALAEEDQPKYLNSPETPLYQKGRILYGLVVARDAIRRENRAIIVEGYMDWLTMVEAGIDNVVAVSGTALTDTQAKLLSRFCERVTMMFDADAAGQRAALRGIDIVFNAGLSLEVAVPPPGDDPDSYIRKHGAKSMMDLLTGAESYVSYRVGTERKLWGGKPMSFEAIGALLKEFVSTADRIGDQRIGDVLINEAATHLGLNEITLKRALASLGYTKSQTSVKTTASHEAISGDALFLRILLESPEYLRRARTVVLPDDFDHPSLRTMYETLLERTAEGAWPTTPQDLADDPGSVKQWSRLLTHPIDPEQADRAFEDGLREFAHRHRQAPQIRRLIAEAERVGDSETATKLTVELSEALRLDKTEPAGASDDK